MVTPRHIDCDTHVLETDHTWSYCDPTERDFAPITVRATDSDLEYWLVGDQRRARLDRRGRMGLGIDLKRKFPDGACDLTNVSSRVADMDRLGTLTQVLFSTFWLHTEIRRPLVEAALARSYNRWIADMVSDSGGRLRWAIVAPVRMMDRTIAEVEFGRANGAVAVHLRGRPAGMVLDDEYLFPLYARAQELDLAIAVHIGADSRMVQRDRRASIEGVLQMLAGFQRVAAGNLHQRFPSLRWAFLEGGATWIPFALQLVARGTEGSMRRAEGTLALDGDFLAQRNMYVGCQMDDDLRYIAGVSGWDSLVVGTDYGHDDVGSDVDACRRLAERTDLPMGAVTAVTESNGARLYGLSPSQKGPAVTGPGC